MVGGSDKQWRLKVEVAWLTVKVVGGGCVMKVGDNACVIVVNRIVVKDERSTIGKVQSRAILEKMAFKENLLYLS